jgi:hypothetical protein
MKRSRTTFSGSYSPPATRCCTPTRVSRSPSGSSAPDHRGDRPGPSWSRCDDRAADRACETHAGGGPRPLRVPAAPSAGGDGVGAHRRAVRRVGTARPVAGGRAQSRRRPVVRLRPRRRGLEVVDALLDEPALASYHLLPSVRGELHAKLGRREEARAELEKAASLMRNRSGAPTAAGRRGRLGRRCGVNMGRWVAGSVRPPPPLGDDRRPRTGGKVTRGKRSHRRRRRRRSARSVHAG